jgi:pre-rRNA-processing protein TSR3
MPAMRYEVVLDSGETANKCTIAPLAYRKDFRLIAVTHVLSLGRLNADVLLHHEGECITQLRSKLAGVTGIAGIDCIWRRLPGLLRRVEGDLPILARIPEGFVTAYPRKSEDDSDPPGGLATIEAIFVAAALLGHWDATLLSEYYFGRRFIEMNQTRFLELGVSQAGDPTQWPALNKKIRNSEQRKADRRRRAVGH